MMAAEETGVFATPIDRSFLPVDVQVVADGERPATGLVARLYSDGQVRSLARYREGRCMGWELRLERSPHTGSTWGVARREPGRGNTVDWESYYADGTCERFDDTADPEPYAKEWTAWVRDWIKVITVGRV
jgi:hypothetical protein